jgi:GntR family histidine utilization transcriptional repressor
MPDSAHSRLTPYAQVKQYLKGRLAAGDWAAGVLMPSEAELVLQFGVSRMTVSRALKELQAEGLIERVQGVGTFAAPLHQVSSTLTLRDLQDEIAERGNRHSARVHSQRALPASAALAEQFGVPVGAPLFHSLIVHFENSVALQCEDRLVNPACAPDYLTQDFSRITPTRYLFQVTALWRARYSIEAARPTLLEAELLGLAAADPCLVMVRRTWSRDAAITLARLVHPGSRYQLEGQFTP